MNTAMMKICKICGKEFETRNSRQLCCSKECSKQNRRNIVHEHYKPVPRFVQKTCPVCGTVFQTDEHQRVFCSAQCQKKQYKKQKKTISTNSCEKTKAVAQTDKKSKISKEGVQFLENLWLESCPLDW